MRRSWRILISIATTACAAAIIAVCLVYSTAHCTDGDSCETGGPFPHVELAVVLAIAVAAGQAFLLHRLWQGLPERKG